MEFSREEWIRYSRHFKLPGFGSEGQQRLKKSRVLVVGTGGLGAPLLQYLTAAGVGTIGIVDFDLVDSSNLHRQVLFTTEDIGRPKTIVAHERLRKLNPDIKFNIYNERLTSENAARIIREYDIVADGTDNFPTRYLVNDACVLLDKTNVYASIYQFEGQVSVFNAVGADGSRGPNYRDLYPTPPPPGMVPSCAEGGVLGVLPGIVGSIQASEVIKIAAGIGETLSGRLFLLDALSFTTRTLKIRKDSTNPLNGDHPTITALIDYEEFCGMKESVVAGISVEELARWKKEAKHFQLIDVREPDEYKLGNLGGLLMPLSELEKHLDNISADQPVVVMCRSGKRSQTAILKLSSHGYKNLLNLDGGILAWKNALDPDLLVI
ncbi:molybdopterin-synthase adenylyltransferase MoeB [Fulvivirga sedimenti]|uniref:Molybdopterin-synthase adenylyltransferase n=1 Tax=Fulvivirga sedimenti TaxID=2879465 RepID=A0A9X1HNY9_9BACT|nr:molybdopterin-synthase adenylyltransferase MoeB [Fulvivirga sedimenti]MCA6073492.1 molybdopterin-synthase adenylyltransferase MoeB [Fulvivirga sedimenti]